MLFLQEIAELQYRVVITSPEMCLEHDLFQQLLSSPKFAEKICAVVIDEAHCISQWGDKFRPIYGDLGTLRAFVAANIPFLITSATLPPLILSHVHKIMHMSKNTTYHLNLGTDRPNIAWFVRMMRGGKSDLEALAFLIPNATDDEILDLVQTMVFFDDINLSLQALKYLRSLLPPDMRRQIAVYNSRRSRRSKERVLHKFREGRIMILLTTEAAGMVC
jgi:superfamily II DNA helicase RecQ